MSETIDRMLAEARARARAPVKRAGNLYESYVKLRHDLRRETRALQAMRLGLWDWDLSLEKEKEKRIARHCEEAQDAFLGAVGDQSLEVQEEIKEALLAQLERGEPIDDVGEAARSLLRARQR